MNEVPIVKVTSLGRPVRKGYDVRGKAFIIDVEYELSDGRKLPGTVTSERKNDLAGSFARVQRSIDGRAFFASFDHKDEYFGTVSKWTTCGAGSAGLVPMPPEATPAGLRAGPAQLSPFGSPITAA